MPLNPSGGDPPPPLPRLPLQTIFATRRELYNRCWKAFEADHRVVGKQYRDLVHNIVETLGGPSRADPNAVADSVAYLLGAEVDAPAIWALAWRLAGNRARLQAGLAVHPWSLQRDAEWIPLHITAARPERRRFQGVAKLGCLYTFQSLAGSYCPGTLKCWWSQAQYTLFSRTLGGTAPKGKYPLRHAVGLVGLRLFGLFTPETCPNGRPGFRVIAAGSAMVAYNRRILAVRGRSKPCPRRLTNPCHVCGVGYLGPDACEFATHARHYLPRACPACGEPAAISDPDETTGLCIACVIKERWREEPV